MKEIKSTQTLGLPRNTAAALSYVLGPLSGVFFLLLVRDQYVKFHSAQSIVVVGGLFLLWIVLSFTLTFLTPIVFILLFILWLMLIYKSWQGDEWEVPYLGKYAR